MTTTKTTTTTMMMAIIDIPCSGDEVGAATGSEEDVGVATTQALMGSSFALGDRQDRVLKIKEGDVKITSTSVPEKHATLGTLHVDSREDRHRGARGQSSDASGGLSCTHWRSILRVCDLRIWMC